MILTFSISDFLRSKILTGFPWNIWSYSFAWSIESLQILNIVGLFAFNLLIITIFFLPVILFIKNKTKFFILSFVIILVFSNYFYGSFKLNSITDKKDFKNINFKIVSAGMSLSDFKNEMATAKNLIKYSNPDTKKKTIFVWPEGVFLSNNLNNKTEIKDLFSKNFSENHLIIFGANTKNESSKDTEYFNSMLIVDKKFNIISKYDKQKLVPFGEFLPFESFLKVFGLKKITPGYSSFSKGKTEAVIDLKFNSENLKVLPLICYEIIFPNMIDIRDEFNVIVNISEDAWFGESIGPHQHFAKAIFRAIESETYIIRSANKGISAFISPQGKIIKSLQPNEIGNIEFAVPIIKKSKKLLKNDLIFLILLITYIFTFLVLRRFKN